MNIQQTQPDHKPDDLDFSPDDILALAEPVESEWKEPQSIFGALLPVEKLTEDLIAEPLRAYVFDEAERMSCPPDNIFAPLMVMLGAIIGTHCGIRPKVHDCYTVVPNLWGAIIAPPGAKKTAALKAGVRFLDRLEEAAEEKFADLERQYKAEYAEFKATEEAIKTDMKTAAKTPKSKYSADGKSKPNYDMDSLKQRLAGMQDPPKPVRKRFYTNNATVEKLHELCKENPRGILVIRDELSGWLAQIEKVGNEEYRAFYLEGWSGTARFDLDRINRGTVSAKSVCVSILGGIQPEKLKNYLSASDDDGMFPRFQVVSFPDKVAYADKDTEPDRLASERVLAIVKALEAISYRGWGATGEEHEIPSIRLEPKAQALYKTWLANLENEILNSKEHPLIIEHLSKFRSFVPSLTLINHLIKAADEQRETVGQICCEDFLLSVKQSKYFESHARRMYGLAIGGYPAAHFLAGRILAGDIPDNFSIRDVGRNKWSGLTTVEALEEGCQVLIERNWLKIERIPPGPKGGRPAVVYRINPLVFQLAEPTNT